MMPRRHLKSHPDPQQSGAAQPPRRAIPSVRRWPVRRWWRTAACAVVALSVTIAGTGVAHALWSDWGAIKPQNVRQGMVMFGVNDDTETGTRYSAGQSGSPKGTPLDVTVPGSVINQVLNGPVVWRFNVVGYAQGTAGMSFDIKYRLPEDNTPLTIDTLLEGSLLRVFPAGAEGDCSAKPSVAPHTVDGDVTLADQLLQAAGANPTGTTIVQPWCVTIDWDGDPPREHTNVASVRATGQDGKLVSATSVFRAMVDYAPKLDPHGTHSNTATARGEAADGTQMYASDQFTTDMYPDPGHEPGITLSLTPHVVAR